MTNHWKAHYNHQIKHTPQHNKLLRWLNKKISSMYFYDLEQTLKPLIEPRKLLLEIGCAPGNFMLFFKERFQHEVHGIDININGCQLTKENLAFNGVDKPDKYVLNEDVLKTCYVEFFKENYEGVFSAGFIEHYKNPRRIVNIHFKLVTPGGMVIILVPNMNGISRYWTSKKLLSKHNLNTCTIHELKKLIQPYGEVLFCDYVGGPFNFPPIDSKYTSIRLFGSGIYGLQRLLIDQPLKLFRKVGLNFNNSYTSPAIIIIARKVK